MKKNLISLTFLMFIFLCQAQEITGDWNGVLSVQGMKLRLVFHISKTDNNYSATMDSPDQGAKGIAMSAASFENNKLMIELSVAKIMYNGTLKESGNIEGTFTQAGMEFPLLLTRTESIIEKPKRPQTPSEPFPYNSENVEFTNNQDSIKLAGTFTYPKGNDKTKYTTVILITGSGAQNRDEELMGHKPFLVLSDYLTRNGIAVLRYDDRGSFKSEGNFAKATSKDFATDVNAAIEYLKTRKEVDAKRIGLIGHSEGGLIAPMVASNNKDVNFIVMMAGPGISGAEILLLQQELIAKANGINIDEINKIHELNKSVFNLITKTSNNDELRNSLDNFIRTKLLEDPEMQENKKVDEMVTQQLDQLMTPWMLNFIRYNPAPTLEKVKCAVLAINGSKDLQVPADINLTAIQKALEKGKNKKFTIKKLAGLNHLFQECKTGSPNEYGTIEQTISVSALEIIANWINELK